MIEFIKEYGVNSLEYGTIINSLNTDIIETMQLSEIEVRKILSYYNEYGIKEGIGKIILNRPDLIVLPLDSLKEILEKINKDIFIKILDNNIEDLILLGI